MKGIILLAVLSLSTFAVQAQTCPNEKHPHAIDLGLPSGTKWSCCNVGSDKPNGFGTYFAFGETDEREIYDDKSYKDVIFFRRRIVPSCDASTVKWGEAWHMPSNDEIKELFDNCTSEWKTINNTKGRLLTGKNGNSVFFPAGGRIILFSNESIDKYGFYWSNEEKDDRNAWYFFMYESNTGRHYGKKSQGFMIRPVSK